MPEHAHFTAETEYAVLRNESLTLFTHPRVIPALYAILFVWNKRYLKI